MKVNHGVRTFYSRDYPYECAYLRVSPARIPYVPSQTISVDRVDFVDGVLLLPHNDCIIDRLDVSVLKAADPDLESMVK